MLADLSELSALARDPLLRSTAPFVLTLPTGAELDRTRLRHTLRQSVERRLNDTVLDHQGAALMPVAPKAKQLGLIHVRAVGDVVEIDDRWLDPAMGARRWAGSRISRRSTSGI